MRARSFVVPFAVAVLITLAPVIDFAPSFPASSRRIMRQRPRKAGAVGAAARWLKSQVGQGDAARRP